MVVPVWGKLRRGKLTSFLLGYLVLVQFSQNDHNTHQEKNGDLEDSIFSFLSIFSVEGKIIKEKTMDPTTRLRHLVALVVWNLAWYPTFVPRLQMVSWEVQSVKLNTC